MECGPITLPVTQRVKQQVPVPWLFSPRRGGGVKEHQLWPNSVLLGRNPNPFLGGVLAVGAKARRGNGSENIF